MSADFEVDVAVIGAGSAGLPARSQAAREGARTLLIERGPYGTTCARVGCMPSKLLIAAADAAHNARTAEQFGVHVRDVRVDGPQMYARVRSERDRFVGFVLQGNDAIDPEGKLTAQVRFESPNVLVTDEGQRIHAKAVVIATGSANWLAPVLRGVSPQRLLTSDNIFEQPDLPESVAVVGVGVVGLELGQALHRLGVRVRFFGHNRALGPISDPQIHEAALRALGEELSISLEANIQSIEEDAQGVRLRWVDAQGEAHEERFEKVLAATGRRPNLEALNIKPFVGELDPFGVPAFNKQTLQVEGLPWFIAGDVSNVRPLLHEAADDGRIAGQNAARLASGQAPLAFERREPIGVVFSHPNIATVGQTYAELQAAGVDFAVGTVSFWNQGRSRVMGVNAGRLNVYGRRGDGQLLGAELITPDGEHLAHLLAWVIQMKMNVIDVLRLPFYHPVVEEGLRTALRDLAAELGLPTHSLLRPIEARE